MTREPCSVEGVHRRLGRAVHIGFRLYEFGEMVYHYQQAFFTRLSSCQLEVINLYQFIGFARYDAFQWDLDYFPYWFCLLTDITAIDELLYFTVHTWP